MENTRKILWNNKSADLGLSKRAASPVGGAEAAMLTFASAAAVCWSNWATKARFSALKRSNSDAWRSTSCRRTSFRWASSDFTVARCSVSTASWSLSSWFVAVSWSTSSCLSWALDASSFSCSCWGSCWSGYEFCYCPFFQKYSLSRAIMQNKILTRLLPVLWIRSRKLLPEPEKPFRIRIRAAWIRNELEEKELI